MTKDHVCNCNCGSCDSGAPHDPGCPLGEAPSSKTDFKAELEKYLPLAKSQLLMIAHREDLSISVDAKARLVELEALEKELRQSDETSECTQLRQELTELHRNCRAYIASIEAHEADEGDLRNEVQRLRHALERCAEYAKYPVDGADIGRKVRLGGVADVCAVALRDQISSPEEPEGPKFGSATDALLAEKARALTGPEREAIQRAADASVEVVDSGSENGE